MPEDDGEGWCMSKNETHETCIMCQNLTAVLIFFSLKMELDGRASWSSFFFYVDLLLIFRFHGFRAVIQLVTTGQEIHTMEVKFGSQPANTIANLIQRNVITP